MTSEDHTPRKRFTRSTLSSARENDSARGTQSSRGSPPHNPSEGGTSTQFADADCPQKESNTTLTDVGPQTTFDALPRSESTNAQRSPVQRLASVLPRNAPLPHMSSNDTPRQSAIPTSLKFKPKAAIRRTKEERDAIERAEAERAASRHTGLQQSSVTRYGGQNEGNDRTPVPYRSVTGRSVGGDPVRVETRHASGLLGGPAAKSAASKAKSGRGAAHASSVKEFQGQPNEQDKKQRARSQVKKEPADKSEVDRNGESVTKSAMTPKRKRSGKLKKEGEGLVHISSEEELDSDTGEKINIERINLISSEDEFMADAPIHQPVYSKGKQRESTPKSRNWMMRPVFMQRQEHMDRAVGLNTEASSMTSAELRRRAKARQEAGGEPFLSEDDEVTVLHSLKARNRRKPKDVEFLRDERKWKGVWTVDEEHQDVQVKTEPEDQTDGTIPDSLANAHSGPNEEVGIHMEIDDEGIAVTDEQPPEDNADKNEELPLELEYYQIQDDFGMSSLYSRLFNDNKDDQFADFAVVEDTVQFDPQLEHLSELREQFRAFRSQSSLRTTKSNARTDGKETLSQTHARGSERPYLVQLPPIMPLLESAETRKGAIKKENHTKVHHASKQSDPGDLPSSDELVEVVGGMSQKAKAPEKQSSNGAFTQASPALIAGEAGALTFYSTGKAIASWGGMNFNIDEEQQASGQAREVFVTDREVHYTKEGESTETIKLGGELGAGAAVGQVRNNLTATPDWEMLLS